MCTPEGRNLGGHHSGKEDYEWESNPYEKMKLPRKKGNKTHRQD